MPIIPTEEVQLTNQIRHRNNDNDAIQNNHDFQNNNTLQNTITQNINHQEEPEIQIQPFLDNAMNITQNEIVFSN